MKNYIKIDGKKIAIRDIIKELEALRENSKEDTLDDVLDRLPDMGWYIDVDTSINKTGEEVDRTDAENQNILNTELIAKQLQAITLLMNVADSLNEGQEDCHWYIYWSTDTDRVLFSEALYYKSNFAYFKTQELAEKAAKLLGDDMIKLIYTGEK